ncbi:diadenosine tetraphosphate (Ap4A) HIT family hydrolase [Streptomyces umbrinus]|uniref:Diadenosine tetraphosphate (Ap4A) HIT family hydrolase n=1 Tax=Streptomyces umbrinus TaxID=67370 RepID=A0ABU0SHF2_9ACTN|nr:HIT domain-containing protein [Streptomyces umbrinus]MDQ1022997.1 diadenosine tetraphosphate (Ap4A) HIT family hydrolase [Streptomyces umbrinus]
MTPPSCYTCGQEERFDDLPLRERITADQHWRVAHAFDTALPGWLVLVPRRHVTAIHELTDTEGETLGMWQVRLSRALHDVTGCVKTYVAQFAEVEGFAHVHFHIIPRMSDLPQKLRGPSVFELLRQPEHRRVSGGVTDEIVQSLRAHLLPDPSAP